jgi:hypothetical protein
MGRNDEIGRLDRWVRDTAVRVVAVCAVGGTGKTALIGHLARDCGYAWAERDALFLEAETRAALSARHDSDRSSPTVAIEIVQ